MIATETTTRFHKAGEHLQLLQSLCLEVEKAMQAIARNDIEALEESIGRQQELSARLSALAGERTAAPSHSPATPADEDLLSRIRSAAARLQYLNLRYSILLTHSSRFVAIMASLFRSSQGQFQQEASGARNTQHTWSCRI